MPDFKELEWNLSLQGILFQESYWNPDLAGLTIGIFLSFDEQKDF